MTNGQGMKRQIILVFAVWVCFLLTMSQANSARYLLQRQKLKQDKGYLLRLYNRQTHHLIWKLAVDDVYHDPIWSADHKTVAFLVNHDSAENAKLLVWQVGKPLRLLPTGSSTTGYLFQDWDGILNVWWSPDKKRILMRAFCSGGADSNSGQLLCYVLDNKRFYEGPKGVRRARWIGVQEVRYWKVTYARPWIKDPLKRNDGYDLPPEEKQSRTWHCP